MTTIKERNGKQRGIAGMLFFLIPLGYTLLWIWIFNMYGSHADRVAQFTKFLPPFFKYPGRATLLFILFCIIAIVLSATSMKYEKPLMKNLSLLTVILSSLMILWLLFTMM
jgi:hypothetical protein